MSTVLNRRFKMNEELDKVLTERMLTNAALILEKVDMQGDRYLAEQKRFKELYAKAGEAAEVIVSLVDEGKASVLAELAKRFTEKQIDRYSELYLDAILDTQEI